MNRTLVVMTLCGAAAAVAISNLLPDRTSVAERKILYWVEPMDPNYRSDKPGKSPMGMELVPVYEGEEPAGGEPALTIDPAIVQNLGVRTAEAKLESLRPEIRAFGVIAPDENRIRHVDVRAAGWIEEARIKTEGVDVRQGDLLFRLYAPSVESAEAEFLQALKIGQQSLAEAARRRLGALGVTPTQIERIARAGKAERLIDVRAPRSGTVVKLNAGEGQYVEPGSPVMSLADLSSVWVMADVYEDQAAGVEVGDEAAMKVPALKGREFKGRVDLVYPTVSGDSRAVRVRLAFANPDGALRPNLYSEVAFTGKDTARAIVIPKEALIRTESAERVILALGDGKFRPAEVVSGAETKDRVVIVRGLSEGERVVTSGQFLIDSEASLDASLTRLAGNASGEGPGGGAPKVAAGMGDVIAVMPEHGMVTIAHGPIPSIGWPAMTMDFIAAPGVDLSRIEKGGHVTFEVAHAPDGRWLIAKIAPMRR